MRIILHRANYGINTVERTSHVMFVDKAVSESFSANKKILTFTVGGAKISIVFPMKRESVYIDDYCWDDFEIRE